MASKFDLVKEKMAFSAILSREFVSIYIYKNSNMRLMTIWPFIHENMNENKY
jgi:hypothetical protein